MSKHEPGHFSREELKKEFQLERMILFSDAVFAVVITLMAIEIKLPEGVEAVTRQTLPALEHHLLPVIAAYTLSFVFIGRIWYEHLKIFSLLKTYDKGLVVRNMVVLFFVGLFPFGASVISHIAGSVLLPFLIYSGILLSCFASQFILHHYILVKSPHLRNHLHIGDELSKLNERKIVVILFPVLVALVLGTWFLVPENNLKPAAMLWLLLLPAVMRFTKRKKKKQVR